MSFPIPSFFKMRRIIAVALVFFGFFFIGFLHRAFAVCLPSCSAFLGNVVGSYSTAQDVQSACNNVSSSCFCFTSGVYYYCRYPVSSGLNYYVVCDDCPDSDNNRVCDGLCSCNNPSLPINDCYSESNIIWTDPTACQYSCKCPDYTGQENYDFETCSEGTRPCSGVSPTPSESCHTEWNITWTDDTSCDYTCTCPDYNGQEIYNFDTCTEEKSGDPECFTCTYGGYYTDPDGSGVEVCFCYTRPPAPDNQTCAEHRSECSNSCSFSCTTGSDGYAVDFFCNCPDPETKDPEPDPDDNGDNPGDGKNPDPDDSDKTCSDYRAACSPSCQFVCEIDSDTGKVKYHNCDCNDDPSDPGPDGVPGTPDDGDPGSADDGSNGWLKQIESNTSGLADGLGEAKGWLKAIKHNTDEVLEDTDNISENVRRGLENDKKYFSDSQGVPYLKNIDDKLGSLDGNVDINVGTDSYSLDGEGDVSGYGDEPVDADLPSDEALNSSFGTFTPAEEPAFVTHTRSALNSLKPIPVSPVCSVPWNIHVGDFHYTDTWDFCQFQAVLSLIGSVLVAMVGFYELYSLTFG